MLHVRKILLHAGKAEAREGAGRQTGRGSQRDMKGEMEGGDRVKCWLRQGLGMHMYAGFNSGLVCSQDVCVLCRSWCLKTQMHPSPCYLDCMGVAASRHMFITNSCNFIIQ